MISAGRLFTLILSLPLMAAGSCDSVDDERIPAYAVSIDIRGAGKWNTYGVAAFGSSRRFILPLRQPAGFPYSSTSATGYGGVLLICGLDLFTATADSPLAYDLSCPVEAKPDIRVEIEGELYEAVCPVCGSRYDVTMNGGAPISGPAASGERKYALRRYSCLPATDGGYVITNR